MDVVFYFQRQFRVKDYFREHGTTLRSQFGSMSPTRLVGLKTLIDIMGTTGGVSRT